MIDLSTTTLVRYMTPLLFAHGILPNGAETSSIKPTIPLVIKREKSTSVAASVFGLSIFLKENS